MTLLHEMQKNRNPTSESSAITCKVNLTIRKTFGFQSFEVMQVVLYHNLNLWVNPCLFEAKLFGSTLI